MQFPIPVWVNLGNDDALSTAEVSQADTIDGNTWGSAGSRIRIPKHQPRRRNEPMDDEELWRIAARYALNEELGPWANQPWPDGQVGQVYIRTMQSNLGSIGPSPSGWAGSATCCPGLSETEKASVEQWKTECFYNVHKSGYGPGTAWQKYAAGVWIQTYHG
jgi:hypothetical protein